MVRKSYGAPPPHVYDAQKLGSVVFLQCRIITHWRMDECEREVELLKAALAQLEELVEDGYTN